MSEESKELHVRKGFLKPVKRPKYLKSETTKIPLGCQTNVYVTVTLDDLGSPVEIFADGGKAGLCLASQLEALCRAISIGLRSGIPVKHYAKTLINISCDNPITGGAKSCGDGIGKVLQKYILKEGVKDE